MLLDRTIDVTVGHALSQDKAFDRVVEWLISKKGDAKEIKTVIDREHYQITSISESHKKRVTLNISVTGTAVGLHSDPIDGGWIEMVVISGAVRYNESRIYSELVAALKP